jgi:HSP20 family protein
MYANKSYFIGGVEMLNLWKPSHELFRWGWSFDHGLDCGANHQASLAFLPEVDIEEREDAFLLRADLPGVSEKEIEVKVEDGVLHLSGRREETQEETKSGRTLRERRTGAFKRSFRLGPTVDAERISASYKNGVLTLVLPKREETKPRAIRVEVS